MLKKFIAYLRGIFGPQKSVEVVTYCDEACELQEKKVFIESCDELVNTCEVKTPEVSEPKEELVPVCIEEPTQEVVEQPVPVVEVKEVKKAKRGRPRKKKTVIKA